MVNTEDNLELDGFEALVGKMIPILNSPILTLLAIPIGVHHFDEEFTREELLKNTESICVTPTTSIQKDVLAKHFKESPLSTFDRNQEETTISTNTATGLGKDTAKATLNKSAPTSENDHAEVVSKKRPLKIMKTPLLLEILETLM